MSQDFNVSIPISPALASAVRVQGIGSIASDNVRSSHNGEIPVHELAAIKAFDDGLSEDRLVIRGPAGGSVVGHVLAFLTDLHEDETVRTFYEEADERVGGPVWELMSDDQRLALIDEGVAIARALLPLWQRHCAESPAPNS